MAEQSHRDEMNAAIRAQRERQAARSNAPPQRAPEPPDAPEPAAADGPAPSLRDRLRRRARSSGE
ncbi:MAG: hypothetical protein ABSB24_16125 [Gaiellaceae bacterium]|jgi:hypothetical protein